MTILPKKKQTKDKSEAGTSSADPHHGHSLPHASHAPLSHTSSSTESRLDTHRAGAARRPTSPPQGWGSPPPVEDLGLPGHEGLSSRFEEFPYEPGSGHNKRRHRSSPHRNTRKHRWDGHRHGHRHERPSTSKDMPAANPEFEDLTPGYNSEDECGPIEVPEDIDEVLLQKICSVKTMGVAAY